VRPAANGAKRDDDKRLAALFDAVGVLALEVDDLVDVPEAFVCDSVAVDEERI
jgi:hypothetical protein